MNRTNLVHPVTLLMALGLVGCADVPTSPSLDKDGSPSPSIHALAPTLTTVTKLTGALEDTPFSISYATLAAADENDSDGDAISFQLNALSSGTLTAGDGSASECRPKLSAGETWTWQADEHANGDIDAFTVEAVANGETSGTPFKSPSK